MGAVSCNARTQALSGGFIAEVTLRTLSYRGVTCIRARGLHPPAPGFTLRGIRQYLLTRAPAPNGVKA
jgi:hypothetical protein